MPEDIFQQLWPALRDYARSLPKETLKESLTALRNESLGSLNDIYTQLGYQPVQKPDVGVKPPTPPSAVTPAAAILQPSVQRQITETRRGVTTIRPEDEISTFASRIISGEQMTSPEDIQFYDNNRETIDAELRRRFSEENQQATETDKQQAESFSEKARRLAARIRENGLSSALPEWAKANLPEGTQQAGFGGKALDEVIAKAIEFIADAVDTGANLIDAINEAFNDVRKYYEENTKSFDENRLRREFTGRMITIFTGKQTKVVPVGGIEIKPGEVIPSDREYQEAFDKQEAQDPIAAYHMTRSNELPKAFGADLNQQRLFDSLPSEERFRAQMGMLQDGKNLMAAAQSMFGSTDVNVYGRQLFRYIQQMRGEDVGLTNKRAVLLATLLGEIKMAVLTGNNPETIDQLRQFDRVVSSYYNRFMHVTAKTLSAGRLLRLFRDNYMADIFVDKILEEEQAKARKSIKDAEADTVIKDEDIVAHQQRKPKSEEEIRQEQKEVKERRDRKKKEAAGRKKSAKSEYEQRAAEKEDEIKRKYGSKQNLVNQIIEKIKKLNCK
jgi:hypothetical protein